MTVPQARFSIEALTQPHEHPREHAQLVHEWATAYPDPDPIEQGYIDQAITALIEKRRIERIRATVRTQKVRTAVRDWERAQEDTVAHWLNEFNFHCPSALVGLLRSAAGCRWALKFWSNLATLLAADGTWFGSFRTGAIQLQGYSAAPNDLYFSEEAFTTWIDCLACQPNPKQKDIDIILDRHNVPKALQDRDVPLWPRDPAECRARLQALVDREIPRLQALEETLRVLYEEPSKAEAQVMALASISQQEKDLLHAQRLHEQSYTQATTALMKVRKQTAAARGVAQARAEHPQTERTGGNIDPWLLSRSRSGRGIRALEVRRS